MADLKVSEVVAGYGAAQVLHELSLIVGSTVAILGPNGAGKTTLLRTISGLIRPRSGQIHWGDVRIDGMRPERIVQSGVVHVPQGRRIFSSMSTEENLLAGAYLSSDRSLVDERLHLVYDIFPKLADMRQQSGGTLSGGEQQMLALGRALMIESKLILLDEPSMGLAPSLIEDMATSLKTLVDDLGLTILLVEQNPDVAAKIADSCHVLVDGKIVESDRIDHLLESGRLHELYLSTTSREAAAND